MKERFLKIASYGIEYSLYGMLIALSFSPAAIELFFGAAFLLFLAKKIIKHDFGFVKSAASYFLFSFLFFMGLSLFNSGPYLLKGLKALVFKWSEYALIFIIVQDSLGDKKKMRNCLVILLGMTFLVCVDTLFQSVFRTDFLRHRQVIAINIEKALYGATASFSHYNSLGTYLVFNLSLVLALLIVLKNKLCKMSLFILTAVLLLCLMLTFSRGSWIGFLSLLILMLSLSPQKGKLIYLFIIYILVIFSLPEIRERTMFIFSPQGDADRFIVWRGALKMIKEHPFLGLGLGTFMSYFREYVSKVLLIQYAHNCYLQIWAESGIFALLSFVLFAVSVFYQGIKALRFNGSPSPLLLGLICAFFGFLIQIFFDSQLYSLQLAVLFWFMAGFIIAIARVEKNKADEDR